MLLQLALSSALAVAPGGHDDLGTNWSTAHPFDPVVQLQVQASPEWERFVAGEGAGWRLRADGATGTPWRMWGPGIHVGATDSADDAVAAVRTFLSRHRELGADPKDLPVGHAVPTATGWVVHLPAQVDGVDVWRSGVVAWLYGDRLTMLGIDTWELPRVGQAGVGHHAALAAATRGLPLPANAEPVWLPRVDHLAPAWVVEVEDAPHTRVVLVTDGEVLARWSLSRHARIEGQHHPRSPNDALVASPMPRQRIVLDAGSSDFTDADGYTDAGPGTFYLTGRYARVSNATGPDGALPYSGEDATWTTAHATQAEIDTYVWLNELKIWGDTYAPSVSWVTNRVDAVVNEEGTCNAYFDGDSIHLFSAGDGCSNTGEIADVVYHEWGHGLHMYSIPQAQWNSRFDASLSEGVADSVSMLQTHSSNLAPFFMEGQPEGLRNLDNDNRYPEDYNGSADADPHRNGLILGGALWDLVQLATDAYGSAAAYDLTSVILTGMLPAGPSMDEAWFAALAADDDDGDLGNGTPHACLLADAFGAHGLDATGGSGFAALAHVPVDWAAANAPIPVNATLVDGLGGCADLSGLDSASVHWRVQGDVTWQEADLTVAGVSLAGELPPQAAGSVVEYYLEADTGAGTVRWPQGGRIAPVTVYVGGVLEVQCFDLEDDDSGFTGEGFTWGSPSGLGTDPAVAASGDHVWATDGGADGSYPDESSMYLETPPIDVGHYEGVFVHYQRWLGVEDGRWDTAAVSVNGEVLWENHASSGGEEHHLDQAWIGHPILLDDPGASVTIRWSLESDQALHFGGWTLDDVCLMAPDTPDNRLGITDLVAEDAADGVHLSWTHPVHEPVAEIVVVRRYDRLPTGPEDGVVVSRLVDPEPGGHGEITDTTAAPGYTAHYAVYAGDGTSWLSWTREGWNAAHTDTRWAAGAGDGDELEGGCQTSPSPTAGGLALLLLAGLTRRRRA